MELFILALCVIDNERIIPKELFLFAEETLLVECLSSTQVSWYFYGWNKSTVLDHKYIKKDNTIVIDGVSADNEGFYECQGTNSENFKFAAKMEVKVMSKYLKSLFELLKKSICV